MIVNKSYFSIDKYCIKKYQLFRLIYKPCLFSNTNSIKKMCCCFFQKKTNLIENIIEQGRKRPLDTPKRMIERRERERKVEGEV